MQTKLLFLISLIFTSHILCAQSHREAYLGTKTLYQAQNIKLHNPPDGYNPVFINHVGRHGSRHLTKDVASTFAYRLLQSAESNEGLTQEGKLLKEKVMNLEKVEKSDFGSISIVGQNEQHLIAQRMYENFKPVFKQQKNVFDIDVTKKIRTTQTSNAFLKYFQEVMPNINISRQINDTTLRPYDLSPAYLEYEERGDWIKVFKSYREENKYSELAKAFSQRFFIPEFFNNLKESDYDKFISDVFGFVVIFSSIQEEIRNEGFYDKDVDIAPFFSWDELSVLGKIDNAESFLEKGPGMNATSIQTKIAVPLLVDFINSTTDFIQNKRLTAHLRFTHAEAIAPFATIMQIEGASESTKNIAGLDTVWNSGEVIPLSANIQWILYKKDGSEKYLVKFLLNEKEVEIKGLPSKNPPYYEWDDVKKYYQDEIKKAGSSLKENGIDYLRRAK